MRNVAELLVPAIHWDTTTGFTRERDRIARALELGVGGFVLHGGPEAEVRSLIKDIRQASKIPLLIGDGDSSLPTLDSTRILARAALREAMQPE